MRLAELGELSLVERIRRRASSRKKNIIVNIGDDAAAFRPAPGRIMLLTADTMAEDVHFSLRWATPYQLGWKLVSINVSDIYAMGGEPLYAAFELTANKNTEEKFIDRLFDGILDALKAYGGALVGGNVSGTKNGLVLSMSLVGQVMGQTDRPVMRKGAKPGHGVYVTGPLGDSACGLKLLRMIKRPVEIEKGKKINRPLKWEIMGPLLERHLMPRVKQPPRDASAIISAMIDISDGLFLDLARLCKESGVGVKIYEDKIPLSRELKKAAEALGLDPLALAAGGGEDYELLFTAPKDRARGGILIGECTRKGRYLVGKDGTREMESTGYKHFGSERKT